MVPVLSAEETRAWLDAIDTSEPGQRVDPPGSPSEQLDQSGYNVGSPMRTVITEGDIPLAGELRVILGSIITPSARDAARERGVRILELPAEQVSGIAPPERTVALGADHGGFRMKETLKPVFAELGLQVRDVGVYEEAAADYPDIAERVGVLVAEGKAARGVIVDGAGIGSAMAANKIPGVRAALCYDRASARNSREHNNANVLTLGGRLLTPTQAEEVLRTWLATPFGGGRHAARVDKISQIERRYRNWTPGNSNNS